jgi:HAE1 family hydrophobic/amphiphilic exporter-1
MVGSFKSVEEIQDFPIRADGLKLKDVAEVRYEEPPLEYGRHLDGDFAIGVTIAQESKANTVEVCDAVQKRIAEMDKDPELEGVNFLTWFSQGAEIKKTLKDLLFTGIFGAILAACVLFLFPAPASRPRWCRCRAFRFHWWWRAGSSGARGGS